MINNLSYFMAKMVKKMQRPAVKNSCISRDAKIEAGSIFVNSSIGRFSYCGYDCYIINTEIGSFCSLSDNISIGGGNHPINWVSTSPAFYLGRDSVSKRLATLSFDSNDMKTVIGNDVWIGRGAFIKAGVSIGDGAVIGMGSIVTKDVEPYAIVAGNPARVLRYRFDDVKRVQLKKVKWWDLSEDELKLLSGKMDNVQGFIDYFRDENE